MRRVTPALVAMVVVSTLATPAVAGHDWTVGHEVPDPGNSGSNPGRGNGRPDLHPHVRTRYSVDCMPDGSGGWYLEVTYRTTPQDPADAAREREQFETWPTNGINADGACPGGGFDAAGAARTYWLTVVPEPAQPTVDPGDLVTGLPAYLVLDGPQTISETITPVAGVTITISGEASYVIDWGDGSPTTTTTSQGVPYPGGAGEITHTYTSVPPSGEVTITVTTVWTGTSNVGPLETISRSESITLPLQEVQAVRDR